MAWDPQQYALFGSHRGRPFVDLLGRVAATEPAVVVDLGCGDGPLTLEPRPSAGPAPGSSASTRRRRCWPPRGSSTISGRVEWVETRAEDWDPASLGAPIDVLVSNAALQWVPGHLDLFPRWVEALAPGGWFAMQVPNNFDAPSHALMREVAGPPAREPPSWRRRSTGAGTSPRRRAYLRALAELGLEPDVWETTYEHVLDPEGAQRSPVLEWVRGTGLRPVARRADRRGRAAGVPRRVHRALDAAYPREPHGVVLGVPPDLRRGPQAAAERSAPAAEPGLRPRVRSGRSRPG